MAYSVVVRHGPSRAYAVLTWLIAAVFLASFALDGGLEALVRYGAYPLLLAVVGWAVFWQPHVVIDDDAVTLVNVVRSVRVPYRAITGLSTQWGLNIATTAGRHQAWAAPSRALNRRDDAGGRTSRPIGADDRTVTGDAHSVAREIEHRRARAAHGETAVRAWLNVREVAVLAAGVALAVLTRLAA